MDKRSRLLSDLGLIGSSASASSDEMPGFLASASGSTWSDDNEGKGASSVGVDSEFLDDTFESDEDIEVDLRLLQPRELDDLGTSALRNSQYEAAVRYLNLARLGWIEAASKQLEDGLPVVLDRTALLENWIGNKYIQLALSKGAFVERALLMEEYENMHTSFELGRRNQQAETPIKTSTS